MIIATGINFNSIFSKKKIIIKQKIIHEKINEPIAPEKVLFGLIFVNFGPLKNFPKIKPPKSEAIHVNKIENKIIFESKKFER